MYFPNLDEGGRLLTFLLMEIQMESCGSTLSRDAKPFCLLLQRFFNLYLWTRRSWDQTIRITTYFKQLILGNSPAKLRDLF